MAPQIETSLVAKMYSVAVAEANRVYGEEGRVMLRRGEEGYVSVTPEAFAHAFVACLERESVQELYLFNIFFDELPVEEQEQAEEENK